MPLICNSRKTVVLGRDEIGAAADFIKVFAGGNHVRGRFTLTAAQNYRNWSAQTSFLAVGAEVPSESSVNNEENSGEFDFILPIALGHTLHEIMTNLLDLRTLRDAQEHRDAE